MKVLVTGAKGFIGKNLVVALRRAGAEVAEYDVDNTVDALREGSKDARVVFHLAGVNRPENDAEFVSGNVGSIQELTDLLEGQSAKPLVVLSSSAQAALDNPYGKSKLATEEHLAAYSGRTGTPAIIYRLPGVFGKWCRPNYNSVVPTFCYNISRGLPISISDPDRVIELVHVDDVVEQFLSHLDGTQEGCLRTVVTPTFKASLGDIAEQIRGFKESRKTLEVPDVHDPFTKRLLATYNSFLEPDDFAYSLTQHNDPRGSLAELLKAPSFGQIFVSRTRPGITRGNHYHDTKIEKFCVIDGDALIRFRNILSDEVIEYPVSGHEYRVVDIPPGFTHSIENVGEGEMIVLFWASEVFDQDRPDTYFEEVLRG